MKTVSRLNLSLISKLRKETNVPLHRAKQALIESPDYEAALKYLQNDPQVLKTALKLSDRPTFQGLISVLSGLNTVAMVQVNSETDFVSKNEIFIKFVDRVTISTLLAGEFDKSKILELPCLDTDADLDLTKTPSSIGDELVQAVGSVGENIAIV